MKRLFGWLLMLSAAQGAEPDEGRRIEVLIYNYAHVAADVLARAEGEAGRIYQRAGIETEWQDCPLSPAEAERYPACQSLPGPTRFALRLMPRPMAERRKEDPMVFGFALFPEDGGFGTVVNVYSDRAAELAKGRESAHAVILGHLMAHELGHLLLGTGSHSQTGLMHVPWHKKELELIAQGSMMFMPWQAEQIRSQVRERSAAGRTAQIATSAAPNSDLHRQREANLSGSLTQP